MQAEGETSSAEAMPYAFSIQSHEGEAKKSFSRLSILITSQT
jgi:hypothetical protein